MSDKPGKKGGKPDKPAGVRIDGVQAVADMLNVMDEASRERLLAGVARQDPRLAATIQKRLFIFADLTRLEGRDAQILFREIPQNLFALALRNAPGDLLKFVYDNLSERSGKMLREEISNQGPRRVSEIEAAQAKILDIARELGAKGKIRFKMS